MDETRCKARTARRLALAVAINCAAACLYAEDHRSLPTTPSNSNFRALLAGGWDQVQDESTAPQEATIIDSERIGAVKIEEPAIVRATKPLIQVAEPLIVAPFGTDAKVPATPRPSTAVEKKNAPPIQVPLVGRSSVVDSVEPKIVRAKSPLIVVPQNVPVGNPIAAESLSLAELIKERADAKSSAVSLVQPPNLFDSAAESIAPTVESVPSVPRVSLRDRGAKEKLVEDPSSTRIEVAESTPMTAFADSPSTAATAAVPLMADDVFDAPSIPEHRLQTGRQDFVVPATPTSIETPDDQKVARTTKKSAAKTEAAKQPVDVPNALHSEVSLTATIHASRLQELARESLTTANDRMKRGAIHSAKNYATEALRSIVAMHDVRDGGTEHAKRLEVALDAIRESRDFGGRFGTVDQHALIRMVGVHKTTVLKDEDLSDISPLHATELYLASAKENLVLAAKESHEGSDALVMLGQIEKLMAVTSDSRAVGVALTFQRAAAEVAPTSAIAHRELGSTLLQQGLVAQATSALQRSVEIEPSRRGYQQLLQASRRLGDTDLARHCIESLDQNRPESEIAIRQLDPKQFAATYRPDASAMVNAGQIETPPLETLPASDASPETPLISKARSFFSFGRRL